MRHLLPLLALLLVAPAVGAQPSDSTASAPRLVEESPSHRRGQTAAVASLGALGGSAVGGGLAAYYVYVVKRPGIFDDIDTTPVAVSSMAGLSLGAAAAASLDRDRGRSFWRSLGGSVLGQAAGYGVGLLVEGATGSEVGYLAVPVGAIGGATVGAAW